MHIAVVGPSNPEEFASDLGTYSSTLSFPQGMGGTPVNSLVRELLDMGHQVSLITASVTPSTVWRVNGERLSIAVVPYRSRSRDRALDLFRQEKKALALEIAACDADVFHAHWTYEFAQACLDARAQPLIVTAHDAPFTVLRHMPDGYRLIRAFMALRVRASVENLTAVSPSLATRWTRQMLYRREIPVITNPVPKMEFPATRTTAHPVIVDVSSSSPLKNVRTLLAAFSLVRRRHPAAELRLVGPGLQSGGEMEIWALKKGLEFGVTFVGPANRFGVASELKNATVFCHTSREESHGICLLEAMNARLPIVAGIDSGSVAWTLFEGEGGLLVDVMDPEVVAAAISKTLEDPTGTAARVARAEELMTARYSPRLIASQYLQEYQKVVALEPR
ncbi:glycosyltransferase [Cryobacterium sandaracinum]|uniref:Glycosyltransferase n=1 Tax=Cryobacterium sandaracinum TaxID=1259247 RepID=A0ABY2JIA2_9MICO|nr:glycosyltransferase family 4 protein [Cryobacterium sandaracinum]TFD06094.1 glycosyltransferase [Cryobacterium sandaracinum]